MAWQAVIRQGMAIKTRNMAKQHAPSPQPSPALRARERTNRDANSTLKPCPCDGEDYASCCGRYHGGEIAPDAKSLMNPLATRLGRQQTPANALVMMRSRYSAYVLKLESYLLATWHPDTRPATLDLAGDATKWLGLKIIKYVLTSQETATVEFIARYKIAGRADKLHEISRFVLEDGRWFYLDGEFPDCE
ncbi:MAG: YchJ family metal-binding protein [Gallionella sp.]|jgi:SEC-C motif-containing protein